MLGRDKLEKLIESAWSSMEDETPPDATLGACLLIAEVRVRSDGDALTAFYVVSSDPRGWVQRALLEEAATAQVFAGDGA